MKAIQIDTQGVDRPLVWAETADPVYGPDEVLLQVHAAALNRADLLQRAGNYAPPPGASQILGMDVAGTIAVLGTRVSGWHIGQRVCALIAGGGYAEQVAVHHRLLMPVPDQWSLVQAAAMPEVFFTAYVNLFLEAGLGPSESVLVHGGASGVGTAAIQLLRANGNPVIVTAGTAEKVDRCRELGANLAINYREEDFADRVSQFTNGQGVDVILDMVGGAYLEQNVNVLKSQGRLVVIATLGGSSAAINLGALMRKRARLIGSVLRSRSLEEKVEIKERFMAHFWSRLADGSIQPVIDRVYPIAEANAAHQHMADYGNIGKIVLQIAP